MRREPQLDLFHLVPRNEGLTKVDWSKGGIRQLSVQRFKRFNSFNVDFDRMTLLVGSNSSGKTSILQAIRLFFWCIDKCLKKSETGYMLAKAVIPFSDFHLIPSHDLRELSVNCVSPNSRARGIILRGMLESGLSFSFCIYASYSTLMVVSPERQSQVPLDDEQVSYIRRAPLYIPGFFGVVTRELLAHDARLEELLNSGHHNEVLRNIILRLKGKQERIQRLLKIMRDEFQISKMDLPFSEKVTEFLRAEYSEPNVRVPLDFVSAGSGFLQVLQIMAHALQNPSPILLLDEPDAHMHHGLQRSFLRVLREFAETESLQVIMASHSETFLREAPLEEIRVIDASRSQAGKFPTAPELEEELSKAGIWPTHLELAEILRTRRVLLLEGSEDEEMVSALGRLTYDDWDSGGRLLQVVYTEGSDDNTVNRLEYVRGILGKIMPDGVSVAHMRDRDLMCDAAAEDLRGDAAAKDLPLFISDVRNREALLVKPQLVERTIHRYSPGKIPPRLRKKGSIEELVAQVIMMWCKDQTDDLPVKIKEYNAPWIRRRFEGDERRRGDKQVETYIRTAWYEPLSRHDIPWKLVDGKETLRRLRQRLQEDGLLLSERAILNSMTKEDFDNCLRKTVAHVHSWFAPASLRRSPPPAGS